MIINIIAVLFHARKYNSQEPHLGFYIDSTHHNLKDTCNTCQGNNPPCSTNGRDFCIGIKVNVSCVCVCACVFSSVTTMCAYNITLGNGPSGPP